MNDTQSPVVLATYTHELEAGLLVNQLREHGIEAQATGTMVSGGRVEIPADVQVLVPSGQLPAAMDLLADLKANEDSIDWDQVDVGDDGDALQEPSRVSMLNADCIMCIMLMVGGLVVTVVATLYVLWPS